MHDHFRAYLPGSEGGAEEREGEGGRGGEMA
jgi:hypothetical protein